MRAGRELAVHKRRRVVLVGMMGSGKTTIGRLLAERTGWPFHDNDELLQRHFGLTPHQLVARRGESRMRAAEAEALALGLNEPAPCIVGAPAGTITDERLRERLADEMVVWLRARPETLAARAVGAAHRPWLAGDPLAWMRQTATARGPLYGSVADLTVDVDEISPEQVTDEILAWIRAA
jgi:shikimate kinase